MGVTLEIATNLSLTSPPKLPSNLIKLLTTMGWPYKGLLETPLSTSL